jgi:hypothetical protein
MDNFNGKIESDYRVERDMEMHGLCTGNVTVSTGATLLLHGLVSRDLHVKRGGKAVIHGMVSGGVYNRG